MAAVTEGSTRPDDGATSTAGARRARRTSRAVAVVDVVEHTDPVSAWAWGTEPKLRWLRWHLGHSLRWRRVFGVQLADLRRRPGGFHANGTPSGIAGSGSGWPPRPAPRCRSAGLDALVHATGQPWRPGPPSCRAPRSPSGVLRRLREAVFVVGRPPDTPERILEAVEGVAGLDGDRLVDDARSEVVAVLAERDWSEGARRPRAEVVGPAGAGAVSRCGGARR